MNCEMCHSGPATKKIHLTIQGQTKVLKVCKSCAEVHDLANPFVGLPDVLGILLLGLLAKSLNQREEQDDSIKCNQCGLTIGEFRSTGMFACSGCYDAFHDTVENVLRRIHGSTKHIGKRPFSMQISAEPGLSPEELREQLDQAIKTENYEHAAQLRDMLRDLKSKQGVGRE
jgi:protein arginine kinase activator